MVKLVIRNILVACIAISLHAAAGGNRPPIAGAAISVDPATDAPYSGAFRDGLRQLGYVEGKDIQIVLRFANGDPAKLHAIVKDLVAMHVDVLVGDARMLKEATTTIPIVSPTMGDPVKTGLVASLARPGGNLTGLSVQSYDLWPKHLELARELVPRLSRICFMFDTNDEPHALAQASNFTQLAQRAGMEVTDIAINSTADIERGIKIIHAQRPQVLVIWSSPILTQHRKVIMKAVRHQLPVISDGRFFAEAGALVSYSVDWPDLFRRSAAYVDRILKGARPGDLPIEQPTKFELVVNLQSAKALNIKIPESILVRADRVIK